MLICPVPGLLAGLFGTKAHQARRAGRATSPAKAAAARRNGTKGGRARQIGADWIRRSMESRRQSHTDASDSPSTLRSDFDRLSVAPIKLAYG